MFHRRLVACVALSLALAACQKPAPQAVTSDDMVMGNPNAPVTVTEYASVACPVCADFANNQFPEFKKKYIDTGQVKYVFREILAHDAHMAAAGFLTARCAGKDKYFNVLEDIFRDQADIEADVKGGLSKVAQKEGLSQKQLDECLADTKAIDALTARTDKNTEEGKITGTPTFDINGQRIESLPQPGELDKAVEAAKAKK